MPFETVIVPKVPPEREAVPSLTSRASMRRFAPAGMISLGEDPQRLIVPIKCPWEVPVFRNVTPVPERETVVLP